MTVLASPAPSAKAAPEQQLSALLTSAAVAPIANFGWIKVTGSDRVRWLNGMTTNSIQALASGEWNYNFFLSSQGRIQGDAVALNLDSSILLGTAADRVPALMELLDRFIIMDDVELADLSAERFGLALIGPDAASSLASIGIDASSLAPLHFTAIDDWQGQKLAIIHQHSPLVPRYELWSISSATIENLRHALTSVNVPVVDSEAINQLRILEGTPLYGTDIRDKELPQETNQTRALHFAKGCYLGQEIVERIRSRGNVHRTFHAFELAGELPAPGTVLEADGKPVGELTSVAAIPLTPGPRQLALGYIRREALERNLTVTYSGGQAKPMPTPFSVAERNS